MRNSWIQTFTGGRFWPLDPRAEDVRLADIAHALSMLCRYTGHTRRFYSVAEHSVVMSRLVPKEDALHALMHDAAEAYIADIAAPVKRHVCCAVGPVRTLAYSSVERRILEAVWRKLVDPSITMFCLPDIIRVADLRMLAAEKYQLMRPGLDWGVLDGVEPYDVELYGWDPATAETMFIERFKELNKGE